MQKWFVLNAYIVATIPGGTLVIQTKYFTTRQNLIEGTCTLNPSNGHVTDTFTIACQGFFDPNGQASLEYKLKYISEKRGEW